MKKNPYLSQTTTKATGTSLTLASIEKLIKDERSDATHKKRIKEDQWRIGMVNNAIHMLICGDGTGRKIETHSINCPLGLYEDESQNQ